MPVAMPHASHPGGQEIEDDFRGACKKTLQWSAPERALTPFLALAGPWLASHEADVWRELKALAGDQPGVIEAEPLFQSARKILHASIVQWIARAAVVELHVARRQRRLAGDDSVTRFRSFIDDLGSAAGRGRFLATYPLLEECIQCRLRQSSRFLIEIVRHFVADRADVGAVLCHGEIPAPLSHIEPGQGDRHDHGRTVTVLTLADGRRLMYKPRSLEMDAAFIGLLQWLRERHIGPDQFVARVLLRGRYGYMEHIPCREVGSPDQAESFYQRLGGLTSLVYTLAGTDMHFENLIACGEYPVLVDMETLLCPGGVERDAIADSILSTCMLPIWTDSNPEHAALCAFSAPPSTVAVRKPANTGTDQLAFVDGTVDFPRSLNQPVMAGNVLPAADYVRAVVHGFESTYRDLMCVREQLDQPLERFRGLSGRVIFRKTEVYSSMLNALAHPATLSDPRQRERLLDKLRVASRHDPGAAPRVEEECAALRCYDVPRFGIRSDEVVPRNVRDEPLPAAFECSGYEHMQQRVRTLSEPDLLRQSRVLGQSVAGLQARARRRIWPMTPYPAETSPHYGREALQASACRLADRILAGGLPDGSGTTYLQLESLAGRFARLAPLDWRLYGGLAGMTLFFAHLGRLIGEARYAAAARDMLSAARLQLDRQRADIDDIGAFSGLAGWCYTLTHLGALWNDGALEDEASSWLPLIEDRLAGDRQLDLIGGAAGALWVCIQRHRHHGDARALDIAVHCAEHLIKHAVEFSNGIAWPTAAYPETPVTGLGHGAGGVALGLAWLGELTGSSRYTAYARRALAYEQATFDPTSGTFADLRTDRRTRTGDPGVIHAWCHGASGIALVRLCLPAGYRDHDWYQTVNASLNSTLRHGLGASHCLCHGDLGNLELFIVAEALSDPRIAALEWRTRIGHVIDRIDRQPRCGGFREAELLGLMTGLSGMGYGLLRLAFPGQVPAVLTLELPKP